MTNMMPEVLVQLLQIGTSDQNKVHRICGGMIQFLSSQGLSIPLRLNPERAQSSNDSNVDYLLD